ncbi:amino acid adenylation domain-containing protein, partial [Nocardia sp. NPDC101769]|uniref:amino acid adenylation domain-containing protein n=1 Tax=Nocardia sp. NPDC101769 TaxID=3364333 RepID=UPI0037F72862
VGMYAVTVAGGAYVPLDPDHPAERNQYALDTAQPVCVLSTSRDGFELTAPRHPGALLGRDPHDAAVDSGQKHAGMTGEALLIDKIDLSGYSDAPITDADRIAPLHSNNIAYVIFTSGSTGRPKGVAVSHSAIVNRLVWMQTEYGLFDNDVVLQKTPATFDVSVWEFFWPLQIGASLVIAKPDGHRDPAYLTDLIIETGVTTAHFVPSMMSVFVAGLEADPDKAAALTSLQQVFASGEALPVATAQKLRELTGARLHNLYGPTEAAVDVTYHEVTDADITSVPIGAPVFNTQVYVLDSRLHPVPVGVAGELYLSGDQLARGYVARPDLTSDRFVANPFTPAGERMYRTGDLVKWTGRGELEYLGRTDFQVKLRGLRIELGEIESALTAIESIAQSVVVVRADERLGEQLVGYVIPTAGHTVDLDAVRAELQDGLPGYMVPTAFVVLDAFPLNASGKLDRKRLPAPVFEAKVFRPPSTPIEEIVAGTFSDVLGVGRVGLDDDFFELGGNSLIATQVVARVGQALDTRIPVRALFDAPTVAGLAARAQAQAGTGTRRELVTQQRPAEIPLSLAQQRMWFLNRFDTASAVNNIPLAVRLTGDLDVDALLAAVGDVLERHEVLRTVYPENAEGRGVQVILPADQIHLDASADAGIHGGDTGLTPIAVTEAELRDRIAGLVLTGFDVTASAPVRAGLFRVSDAEVPTHVLVFVVHHISGDGWSVRPLARDVMVAYMARANGGAPQWAPLPVQYADFALWQRETLGSEDEADSLISQQVSYWSDELAGLPDQIDLPSDRPRPAVASNAGGVHEFSIAAELLTKLNNLAREHGASLFMAVHAAFAALLARLSNGDDIAIGTAVAGRGEQVLDDAIGMFVNTLVLRTAVDASTSFADLLSEVRERDLEAFANADVPFERLVEILNPARSQARHPLFQVMLSFQNTGAATFALPGLEVAGVPLDVVTAKFDLHLNLTERVGAEGDVDGMVAEFTYATDIFDAATVSAFADRLVRLFSAVVVEPAALVGDIELLDDAERRQLLRGRNATEYDVERVVLGGSEIGTEVTLASMFETQLRQTPDLTALVFEGTSLSYAEFASRVHKLARHLISEGVGPDSYVALGMRRSFELLVGMYAVTLAGGAYVPLDPDHPAERNQYVLDTAQPVCVLSTTRDGFETSTRTLLIDELEAQGGGALSGYSDAPITDADRIAPLHSNNIAYVIFTSGSTGRPKGVAVSHSAIVNRLVWMQTEYGLFDNDVVLQKTPATFDVSVWEFFWPLQIGASLVIAKPDGHRDPAYLTDLIIETGVTTAHFVPSMMSVFVAGLEADPDKAAALTSLQQVFASGEALPVATAQKLRELTGARLHNLYGPTEAAVDVTYHEVTDADITSVPIGAPVFNTQVYVLDSRLHPVAPGVAGELYLSGVQLARGYVARPDLTADRFVADPFHDGERMYRTGDLVKWTGRGEIEYLGRTDFQVKLRGLRIELGEIESALTAIESIAQSVVVVRGDERLGEQLVGYLIPATGFAIELDAVRATLRDGLPGYMVPTAFVVLDAFPLNASGKLDRKALPAPVFEAKVFRAPSTPIEESVAAVFAEVLGVGRVGLDDDFFELGGNSLIATQVGARLGAALDTQLAVRDLFEASTVAALAARVERNAGSGARPRLIAGNRPEFLPLSPAQRRYWFLNQYDTSISAVDNIPAAVRLIGALDLDAMKQAVGDVIARHEVLRTIYPQVDEGPHQVILPVSQTDLSLALEEVTEAELLGKVIEFAMTTFDVTVEVPLAIKMFRITDSENTEHVLAFTVHHISADGASMGPMARDTMAAYMARVNGDVPQWAPLAVQYADYALWQRAVLGAEDDPESLTAEQIAYWTHALAGLPDQLELPADRPGLAQRRRSHAAQSVQGKALRFDIDAERHAKLRELARANNASLFMVVHAALAVLLARLSGTEDIAVGTPIAGRGERELDDLIGMFVNTLVLRTQVDPGTSFAELLFEVRERDLEAFANADVPFERLVEVLNPVRSVSRNPLFQVGLSFQNLAETVFELPGLRVAPVAFDAQLAKTDLQITVYDLYAEDGSPAELVTEFGYAADLFDEPTVVSFIDRLVRVLDAVIADAGVAVGEIELLEAEERSRTLVDRNDTRHKIESELLLDGFHRAVAEFPARVAVAFEGQQLTYSEFDARVNQLARLLISQGVGAESLVGLAIRRSLDLVIGMYAIVTAGGAWVPLDPDHPGERIAHILETAQPSCVLTTTADAVAVPDGIQVLHLDAVVLDEFSAEPVADAELRVPVRPENPAYVIFTSGSTGRPKGVAVSHNAIHNQISWMLSQYPMSSRDVYLQKTATTFDVSLWGYFMPLRAGAMLVVATHDGHRDTDYIAETMAAQGVTVTDFVPSMLSVFAAHARPGSMPSLRDVFAIGEALPPETVDAVLALGTGIKVHNLYGPTEAAVSITHWTAEGGDAHTVPIGLPQWNSRVYVLDARLGPVPAGVPGELYLAGDQLARGYVGRPELTSDRFVANPFEPGERMYRTGDLVVWRAEPDRLEYIGRTDFQVKFRGQRIELGEIETVLLAQACVSQAVAVVVQNALGDQLVAYVVAAPGYTIDQQQLLAATATTLPAYMVPGAIVALEAFPLNTSGKLDRKALPAPVFAPREFRAPEGQTEIAVAAVFAGVLGVDSVGADDDFFALGGNSLLATQVAARLGAALDTRVPVRTLFEVSTVAGLAATLAPEAGAGDRLPLVARQRPEHLPLSLAQQRMWYLNQFDIASAVYNLPVAVRLTGELDVSALQLAVRDVVERHETLHTIYPQVDGVATQVILNAADVTPDLTPVVIAAAELQQRVTALITTGFDVTVEVPVHAKLFRVEGTDEVEHVLVFVTHHIAADGWSMGPLTRDVMVAYAARAAGVAPGWAPLP